MNWQRLCLPHIGQMDLLELPLDVSPGTYLAKEYYHHWIGHGSSLNYYQVTYRNSTVLEKVEATVLVIGLAAAFDIVEVA